MPLGFLLSDHQGNKKYVNVVEKMKTGFLEILSLELISLGKKKLNSILMILSNNEQDNHQK